MVHAQLTELLSSLKPSHIPSKGILIQDDFYTLCNGKINQFKVMIPTKSNYTKYVIWGGKREARKTNFGDGQVYLSESPVLHDCTASRTLLLPQDFQL